MAYWLRSSSEISVKAFATSSILKGKNALPPVCFGEMLQNLVAAQLQAAGIRRNGVDDDLGALRHLDRLFARHPALIVLTVTQQNDGAAGSDHAVVFLHQLVTTSEINGIVHCRAAARAQHAYAVGELFRAVGEVLGHLGRGVESNHEGLIVLWPDNLVQELDRSFLLELEAVAHRVAGINEQADAERQIGLPAERMNAERRLDCRRYVEIVLRQVLHKVIALVGHGEDHVHFVDPLTNRRDVSSGTSEDAAADPALPVRIGARRRGAGVVLRSIRREADCCAPDWLLVSGGGGAGAGGVRAGGGYFEAEGALGSCCCGAALGDEPTRQRRRQQQNQPKFSCEALL